MHSSGKTVKIYHGRVGWYARNLALMIIAIFTELHIQCVVNNTPGQSGNTACVWNQLYIGNGGQEEREDGLQVIGLLVKLRRSIETCYQNFSEYIILKQPYKKIVI